ncbi:unnamed protein product, partial [Adineta ricciae]
MTASFEFRAVLINIQDLLSNTDRERLNFLLGEDVPKTLREDASVGGSFRILEHLFQKTMITNQDCDYLIEAFMNIHCHDAAKRLKEYQRKQSKKNQRNISIQEILWQDNEENEEEDDKIAYTKPTSDASDFQIGMEPLSPSPNVSVNNEPQRNLLLSAHNRTKKDVDQSRSKGRAFKISHKIRQRIVISIIILSVLSLPLVIILSMKYHERTSKLKEVVKFTQAGLQYYINANYSEALRNFKQASDMQSKILSPIHSDLATTFNNIGVVYYDIGEPSNALDYHNKALRIQQKSLSQTHPDIGITHNHIGSAYLQKCDYSRGLKEYNEALQIQKRSLPTVHPDLAITYNNIGSTHLKLGEYQRAIENYKLALDIQEKSLNQTHS